MGLIEGLFGIIVGIIGAVLFIVSCFWIYIDAQSRQKSGCLLVILLILFGWLWPLTLLIWIAFRPPKA